MKPLSETRWVSRIEALKPLHFYIGNVYDALTEIALDKNKDSQTRHEAQSLAEKIKTYEFITSVVLWYDILNNINAVSKMLLNPDLNLNECLNALNKLIKYFEEFRSDDRFKNILQIASQLAVTLDVDCTFKQTRLRRKNGYSTTSTRMEH